MGQTHRGGSSSPKPLYEEKKENQDFDFFLKLALMEH